MHQLSADVLASEFIFYSHSAYVRRRKLHAPARETERNCLQRRNDTPAALDADIVLTSIYLREISLDIFFRIVESVTPELHAFQPYSPIVLMLPLRRSLRHEYLFQKDVGMIA